MKNHRFLYIDHIEIPNYLYCYVDNTITDQQLHNLYVSLVKQTLYIPVMITDYSDCIDHCFDKLNKRLKSVANKNVYFDTSSYKYQLVNFKELFRKCQMVPIISRKDKIALLLIK